MRASADELAAWQAALDRACADSDGVFRSAIVVDATDSTQDEARRRALPPGAVVAALRQLAGRGRLGRPWADTGGEGLAMTLVAPVAAPDRLSLVGAMAAVFAIESALGRRVGIKWPNDVIVGGRKIAGVLVEIVDDRALIGIGINVRQSSWPAPLELIAASLFQLGVDARRESVAAQLVISTASALVAPDAALVEAFSARCVLRGTRAVLRSGGVLHAGRVIAVHPQRGIVLETDAGTLELPAATTTVVQ